MKWIHRQLNVKQLKRFDDEGIEFWQIGLTSNRWFLGFIYRRRF